ncbi:hypothetical protein A4G19_07790 [Pasteurellaceae bacterium Macca]|nr:hypothetical protein [Pasteurellaceae bacterium Macca]
MQIEYDETKNQRNIQERGLPFSMVREFEFDTAFIKQDRRQEYAEVRYQALGFIQQRLYVLVFCLRNTRLRIISFRKANQREIALYERYR